MAIPQILSDLDPHSVYINAADAQKAADDLKASFSGIGVEFVIRQDTIHVQNVIKNGPAQQAGIIAGDKIVNVDGKPFVGKVVTNEEAMRRLKGPKGTKVKVGVMRYGSKDVKYFTITSRYPTEEYYCRIYARRKYGIYKSEELWREYLRRTPRCTCRTLPRGFQQSRNRP